MGRAAGAEVPGMLGFGLSCGRGALTDLSWDLPKISVFGDEVGCAGAGAGRGRASGFAVKMNLQLVH
jgi:hypothetical protein